MLRGAESLRLRGFALALLVAVASGCAAPRPRVDPLERSNRAAFALDRFTYETLLWPVTAGLDLVFVGPVRRGTGNLLHNLSSPKLLVADLAQGRVVDGGEDLARFLLNTTVGLAGLFDVAGRVGLERHDEDLGQAFCAWGIPFGPYVHFPLLGPSSALEAVSITLDTALAPADSLLPYLAWQSGRALLLADIREAREGHPDVDPYDYERVAYQKNRIRQVRDEPFAPIDAADLAGDAAYGTCGYRRPAAPSSG